MSAGHVKANLLICSANDMASFNMKWNTAEMGWQIIFWVIRKKNARTLCEICSKFTINKLTLSYWRFSCIFIVNFVLLTLNKSYIGLIFLLKRLEQVLVWPEEYNQRVTINISRRIGEMILLKWVMLLLLTI